MRGNRVQQIPAISFVGMLQEKKQQPSLEELEREVVVLRNKIRSLELSHRRIEREARRLTEKLEVLRSTIRSKTPVEARAYKIAL